MNTFVSGKNTTGWGGCFVPHFPIPSLPPLFKPICFLSVPLFGDPPLHFLRHLNDSWHQQTRRSGAQMGMLSFQTQLSLLDKNLPPHPAELWVWPHLALQQTPHLACSWEELDKKLLGLVQRGQLGKPPPASCTQAQRCAPSFPLNSLSKFFIGAAKIL